LLAGPADADRIAQRFPAREVIVEPPSAGTGMMLER
jgi:hypothetical protein